jgi:hypothetical protein
MKAPVPTTGAFFMGSAFALAALVSPGQLRFLAGIVRRLTALQQI